MKRRSFLKKLFITPILAKVAANSSIAENVGAFAAENHAVSAVNPLLNNGAAKGILNSGNEAKLLQEGIYEAFKKECENYPMEFSPLFKEKDL